jgi:hypothetical protein
MLARRNVGADIMSVRGMDNFLRGLGLRLTRADIHGLLKKVCGRAVVGLRKCPCLFVM